MYNRRLCVDRTCAALALMAVALLFVACHGANNAAAPDPRNVGAARHTAIEPGTHAPQPVQAAGADTATKPPPSYAPLPAQSPARPRS